MAGAVYSRGTHCLGPLILPCFGLRGSIKRQVWALSCQGFPCLTPARHSCNGPVIHQYEDPVAKNPENLMSNILGSVVGHLTLILEEMILTWLTSCLLALDPDYTYSVPVWLPIWQEVKK